MWSRCCVLSRFHCVWLAVSLWTVARPAPLSMEFPSQHCRNGSRSLLQGVFRGQGLHPALPHCKRTLHRLSHRESALPSVNSLLLSHPLIHDASVSLEAFFFEHARSHSASVFAPEAPCWLLNQITSPYSQSNKNFSWQTILPYVHFQNSEIHRYKHKKLGLNGQISSVSFPFCILGVAFCKLPFISFTSPNSPLPH